MAEEKKQTEKTEQEAAEQEAAKQPEADAAAAEKVEEPAAEPQKELSAEEKLQAEVESLKKELADEKEKYLRLDAEYYNYRTRSIKEKQEAFDYANANLLSDLLESIDNFDRALDAASTATEVSSVVDGVKMIRNQLVSMLENKYNLAGYGEKGDAFDSNIHEAIGSMAAPVAEPVCSEVYLKGYKLKDRIIRYAKVMVQMPDGSVAAEDGKKTEPADE